MRIHTSDSARAGQWRDIFGTDVLPVREIQRGDAPGVSEATFYVLDDTSFSDAIIRRAAEWVSRQWGLLPSQVFDDIRGDHGLPIIDKGDITFGVDVRMLA